MEFFALIRTDLVKCGIEISQKSTKNHHPFNVKNSTVFFIICLNVFLIIAVLIIETNSFNDRIDMVNKASSTGTCGICYIIIAWKTSKLLEFINYLADVVNASE